MSQVYSHITIQIRIVEHRLFQYTFIACLIYCLSTKTYKLKEIGRKFSIHSTMPVLPSRMSAGDECHCVARNAL